MDIEDSGGKFFIQDLNGELREVGSIGNYMLQDATVLLGESNSADEQVYRQNQSFSFTCRISKSLYKSLSIFWDKGRRARRWRARMRRMGLFQDVPAQAEADRKEGK